MSSKKTITLLCVTIICVCAIFGLTGCGCSKADVRFAPTNITYDGGRIIWQKVAEAEYYTVSINGGEEKRANATFFNYNASGEEFDVTVSAIVNGITYGETVHFTPLDTVENITVEKDGTLSWQEVTGATGYKISVDGKVLSEDVVETKYLPQPGGHSVKIRAVVIGDNSYYSLWSQEIQLYINEAPTSVNYDGEFITWLGNSSSYEVTVNGKSEKISETKYLYNSDNHDFVASVKALGNYETTFDSKPTKESFYYLKTATDFAMENGVLSWTEVDKADGYTVKINGAVQQEKLMEPRLDTLPAGATLEIEVRPYKTEGKFFSSWSEKQNVYLLNSPVTSWNADLELDGEANNNLVWDLVNGAVGYTVEIEKDGNVIVSQSLPASQMSFPYAFIDVGEYKVRVKAVSEAGSDFYDSKYSQEIKVIRLAGAKPEGNNYIVSNANSLSDGFTVKYQPVFGAMGYQLYKDGVLLDGKYSTGLSISDRDVAADSVSAGQSYTYLLRSVGGIKVVGGQTQVTLSSLTSQSLSFEIAVLPMPTEVTMAGFNLKWKDVNGNNGYAVSYSGVVYSSTQTTYNLSTLSAGNFDVSVCTRGNGGAILSSNYTAPIKIERLKCPTNIKISYGAGDGQLMFDAVQNASSYSVYLDLSTQALPENAYDNMYQFIKEEGTVLSMVAVANEYNAQKTVYYMSSEHSPTQQFIKMAAPTFSDGAFSNSNEVMWNVPDNINSSEYTPTYEVWIDNVAQTGGEQNATRFNIQYLEGGRAYTFKIKAIGNDSQYLDSGFSKDVEIFKLETPKITIKNNQYVWLGVTNASSYVLEIDGKRVDNDVHVSGSEYNYTPYYTTKGEHTVKLYAVGDGGYKTINSDTYTYTQVVEMLFAPEISYSYSNDTYVNGGSITVNIVKESLNSLGYIYEIAGESIESLETSCSKQIENTGIYYVRVKACGGTIDKNEIYYIDSQYAGGNAGYSLILLAHPTVSSFSFNSDGAFKWGIISGSYGYDYQISFDNGEYGALLHSGTASLDPIINFKSYKTIKIKVRASGNGSDTVTSQWVEYTWTNPNL